MAEELLVGLEGVQWPERVKQMQTNWIGKSEGVELDFGQVRVFTTRPETVWGAKYVAVAPDNEVLEPLGLSEKVKREVLGMNKVTRQHKNEVVGVDTGITVRNPVTGEDIPLFVASYVVSDYGTGAVMGVPAHDTRDMEFCRKYLPQVKVEPVLVPVEGKVKLPYTDKEGVMTALAGEYAAQSSHDVVAKLVAKAMKEGYGRPKRQVSLLCWS
jgi:leucyl-tRNA synthetase